MVIASPSKDKHVFLEEREVPLVSLQERNEFASYTKFKGEKAYYSKRAHYKQEQPSQSHEWC